MYTNLHIREVIFGGFITHLTYLVKTGSWAPITLIRASSRQTVVTTRKDARHAASHTQPGSAILPCTRRRASTSSWGSVS